MSSTTSDIQGMAFVPFTGRILEWLMREVNRCIAAFREDHLPTKSCREHLPHLVWVMPVTHRNFDNNILHIKFGDSLAAVGTSFQNTSILKLKQLWDPRDNNLASHCNGNITDQGLHMLWAAVDKTARYADVLLQKKLSRRTTAATAAAARADDQQEQMMTSQFLLPRPPHGHRRRNREE